MERNNVLLKITDLRQYFPVGKKKGLYVKANDGISLNIYCLLYTSDAADE